MSSDSLFLWFIVVSFLYFDIKRIYANLESVFLLVGTTVGYVDELCVRVTTFGDLTRCCKLFRKLRLVSFFKWKLLSIW